MWRYTTYTAYINVYIYKTIPGICSIAKKDILPRREHNFENKSIQWFQELRSLSFTLLFNAGNDSSSVIRFQVFRIKLNVWYGQLCNVPISSTKCVQNLSRSYVNQVSLFLFNEGNSPSPITCTSL